MPGRRSRSAPGRTGGSRERAIRHPDRRVPYIQLDLPREYPEATKSALADEVGALFAEVMQPRAAAAINIGFRELGAGNLYRWRAGAMSPVLVVLCDIRRGRPPEQRERFARALVERVARALDWPADDVVVEFTQHSGDEMFRDGELAPDWSADEAR
jgi:phenylpyruvate tautomerase PptA (4-oxalocrotonate tautomerase family)